jgi:hypothetical protein
MNTRKRHRHMPYSIRFSPEERDRAKRLSEQCGLPLSALIRHALFNSPPPRAVRRPTINHQAVAKLLGELGKLGSNINKLARHANAGRYQTDSVELAMRALLELRTACMEALGREQDRRSP